MKKNVGPVDRIARLLLGVILLTLAFTGPQSPWGYIGIIPLLTAFAGFCPLYPLFGLNTCPRSK